jgi:Protein of unknown function (DUF2997)
VADKQKMEITILPNGEVSIKVLCVAGPSCESVSRALEESLGSVKAKERTAEYYQEATVDAEATAGTKIG